MVGGLVDDRSQRMVAVVGGKEVVDGEDSEKEGWMAFVEIEVEERQL